MEIPEADWKRLRAIEEGALDRLLSMILNECRDVIERESRGSRERYHELYRLIQKRDRDISRAFDDMRRSNAIERLVAMRSLGAVTDEELAGFSKQTQAAVGLLTDFLDDHR